MLVIHQLHQSFVQYQVRRGMKHNEYATEVITLSNAEYHASMKHGREITVKGKLYDIKSTSFAGDSVSLEVIHDKAEEHILTKIKDFFGSHKRASGKLPFAVQKIIALKYVPPTRDLLVTILSRTVSCFSFLAPVLSSNSPDIPSPPPKY